ncbi:VOC family protein [Agromyces archimandritae]|uniref:VOC family protein n=1 Tax=Agromyces archimandritae TaxID=2781962 RepID=A0A975IPM2_9MICO|nr:VOC family protein [Agromyces archimandritae]QTX05783.1 VOC family protein [Agromyces archimandritae]
MTKTHAHRIPNSIDYLELTVTDLPEAKAFYAAAFGWEFTDYGEAYAGIRTSAEAEGEEAGGLLLADEARPAGGPFPLLYSDELEATLTAVTAAGGEIVEPPYPFPGGRRFHFRDPSGNELGVWSTV